MEESRVCLESDHYAAQHVRKNRCPRQRENSSAVKEISQSRNTTATP
jgi:hypothetical protein